MTAPTPPANDPGTPQPSPPATDWQAEAEKWKGWARKHEDDAKALRAQAGQLPEGALSAEAAKTLTDERDSLRTAAADVDALKLDHAQNLAMSRLHTRLARAGLPEDDVEALSAAVDPSRLLAEGVPSDEAIAKLATALSRRAGASPDPDQGAGRGTGPSTPTMSELIRAGAGRGPS